jgi:hypothetical protein
MRVNSSDECRRGALAGIDFERMIHFNADFDPYFIGALANFSTNSASCSLESKVDMLKCTDTRKGIIFVRHERNPNLQISRTSFLTKHLFALTPKQKEANSKLCYCKYEDLRPINISCPLSLFNHGVLAICPSFAISNSHVFKQQPNARPSISPKYSRRSHTSNATNSHSTPFHLHHHRSSSTSLTPANMAPAASTSKHHAHRSPTKCTKTR